MLKRLLTFGIQRAIGGPAKSWVFTSGAMTLYRLVKKQTGRREVIDLSASAPGDKFIIEHLPITHKEQMKEMKRTKKSDKKLAKAEKASAKATKKAMKAARKSRRRSKA